MKIFKNMFYVCMFVLMCVPSVVFASPTYECPYCKTTFDLAIEDTLMVYTTEDNLVHIYSEDCGYQGELIKAYICPFCEAPLIVPDSIVYNAEEFVQEEKSKTNSQVTVLVNNVPEDWDKELFLTFYDLNTYQEYYIVLYKNNNFIGRLSVPAGTYCIASAGAIGDAAGRISVSWSPELDTFTLSNKQVVSIDLSFSQETLDKYYGVYEEPEQVVEKPPVEEPIIEEIVEEEKEPSLLVKIIIEIIPYVIFFFIGLGIFVLVDKYKKNMES